MTNMNEKPEVDFPVGEPPLDLEIVDIVEGDGAEAKAGDVAHVHYVGVTFSGGEEFDSSWNRGAPLSFPLGAGRVIQGWDQGIVGKNIGSRLLISIPPEKGYGLGGHPGAGIKGTDTLVFVVDVLGMK